jgi:hypothetical protein
VNIFNKDFFYSFFGVNLVRYLLLPVFAILFVFVKFFISSDTLNSLEAIPTTYLSSNLTAASQAAGTLITALSSSGFTVGSSALVNNTNSTAATSLTYSYDGNTSSSYTKPYGIAVSGNYMYVTHNGSDLVSIYDITDTTNPTFLTSFATTCTIGDILVASSTLYVTNYTANNFRVYDLTASSTNPSFVRTVATGNYPMGITKSAANYIYVANNTDNSIKIYDAASSTNPTLSATYSLPSNNPTGLAVKGTNLYVAHYNQAIVRVLSISTATAPTNVTTIAVGTNPMGLAVYNNILLVSNYGSNNIYQWNITTSSAPAASGNASFSTVGVSPTGMAFSSNGQEMYVANNGSNSITAYTTSVKERYVAMNWKCGSTPGCYLVTYTGTGANRTLAHSMGSTPAMMFVKRTDTTGNWMVYHQGIKNTTYLGLNSTNGVTTDATVWNSASTTSSTISLGTNSAVNASGGTYEAYLFAEKSGFSKFGTYTGNASSNGPFVYTGFKPKYILVKNASAGSTSWVMYDTSRNTYNVGEIANLKGMTLANSSNAETQGSGAWYFDSLANGFKVHDTGSNINGSGNTMIYAAFADYPFEYATTNGLGTSIASSTRFDGSTSYLNRTFAAGNATWTMSVWVKRGTMSTQQTIMAKTDSGASDDSGIYFQSDRLAFSSNHGTVASSTAVFNDPSKWYHVVVVSASSTTYGYVDGNLVLTYPGALNFFNNTATTHFIGKYVSGGSSVAFWNGNMADMYFVGGLQLDPTYFAGNDANGNWSPKTYSGAYGTNGFHLTFSNPASPGTDSSGQGNNWTPNNIATTDNLADSPTNNFPIMNSIAYGGGNPSFTEGGLKVSAGSTYGNVPATIPFPTSGKWYSEMIVDNLDLTTDNGGIGGIFNLGIEQFNGTAASGADGLYWYQTYVGACGVSCQTLELQKYVGGSATQVQAGSLSVGDVIGFAYDASTGNTWIYKNGVIQAGNPVAGTSPSITFNNPSINPVYIYFGSRIGLSNGNAIQANFGQGGQSGLTYDSASGGYFKYTPPSGFKALSSANMITAGTTNSSLKVPKNYFNTVIYNGNGSSQSISSLAFQPDFIWIKDRTTAVDHVLYGDGSAIVNTVASFFQWFEF